MPLPDDKYNRLPALTRALNSANLREEWDAFVQAETEKSNRYSANYAAYQRWVTELAEQPEFVKHRKKLDQWADSCRDRGVLFIQEQVAKKPAPEQSTDGDKPVEVIGGGEIRFPTDAKSDPKADALWAWDQVHFCVDMDGNGPRKCDLSKRTCDPPSPGAVAALRIAAANPNRFFERVMAIKPNEGGETEMQVRERKSIAELRTKLTSLLERFRNEQGAA